MKLLTERDLKRLAEHEGEPCVSIIVPTFMKGQEVSQNPIRFKNLTRECEREMKEKYPGVDEKKLLNPAFGLFEDAYFWSNQSKGFAMFLSPDFTRVYNLPNEPKNVYSVGRQFYVLDLLEAVMTEDSFYILALSQKDIKLFEADSNSIDELPVENAIKNIEDLLVYNDAEEQVQMRSVPSGKSTGTDMVFHGQGNIADDKTRKKYVGEFFVSVADGIDKYLDGEKKPLVLAGVDYSQMLFRKKSSYKNIAKEGIGYNEGQVKAEELHRKALKIVEPGFKKDKEIAEAKYNDALNTPLSSDRIEEILPAAVNGRIDFLLVDPRQKIMGSFNPVDMDIAFDSNLKGAEDLVNLCAVYSLKTEARVFPVDSGDGDGVVRAVFRY